MAKSTTSESQHNQQQKQAKHANIPDHEFGTEMYPDVKEHRQKVQKSKKQGRKRRNEPKEARNRKQ